MNTNRKNREMNGKNRPFIPMKFKMKLRKHPATESHRSELN